VPETCSVRNTFQAQRAAAGPPIFHGVRSPEAYLDANKNGFRDGAEAGTGLGLYAKIYATLNASGLALC
jgi:hypothetical protein